MQYKCKTFVVIILSQNLATSQYVDQIQQCYIALQRMYCLFLVKLQKLFLQQQRPTRYNGNVERHLWQMCFIINLNRPSKFQIMRIWETVSHKILYLVSVAPHTLHFVYICQSSNQGNWYWILSITSCSFVSYCRLEYLDFIKWSLSFLTSIIGLIEK